MPSIVLSTLNARYSHASLGLRYLLANMGDLRPQTHLAEFIIGTQTERIVEQLLALKPSIIGFGVYIWNVEETTKIVALLKTVAPEIKIILGGPEVSYETLEQPICQQADFIITGWGDVSFPKLVRELLQGKPQLMKVIAGIQPPLQDITLPYDEYTDEDIKQRIIYVEASRGCPFKCEFCLSALDKTAWAFPLEPFLAAMERLYQRGLRQFKFVDRTFNLNIKTSQKILDFFLDKIAQAPDDKVYAHFELVPDHLPDALKDTIARFPAGALQFEIGIQTFNPDVQALISRKQDNAKAIENLQWLTTQSKAHLHVDLIAGLPGEDLNSFAQGFDKLWATGAHEIQFGILKRLRGTPIIRHTQPYAMRYLPHPPYTVMSTQNVNFFELQRMMRFARYWDMIANSGRFKSTLALILDTQPFARFMALSDALYAQTGKTHAFALDALMDLVYRWLLEHSYATKEHIETLLVQDFMATGAKGRLCFMTEGISTRHQNKNTGQAAPKRQQRHLGTTAEAATLTER